MPIAEIISCAQGGVDPKVMGLGPVPAVTKALRQIDMSLTDMDVLELNEALRRRL